MRALRLWTGRAGARVALLGLALAAAGCGPTYVYFRPVEGAQAAGPGWVARGEYRVPPEMPYVNVSLSARGTIGKNPRGVEFEQVNVQVAVVNRAPQPWLLNPAEVKLVDDDGRAVTGAEAYRGRNRVQEIQVPPGAGDRLELVIELPPPIRFSSMGSFVLIWPYRYGDKMYESRAKFLKIEQVNYYYPDSYYYYPYGYSYPYPYPYSYGPWYYSPALPGMRRRGVILAPRRP